MFRGILIFLLLNATQGYAQKIPGAILGTYTDKWGSNTTLTLQADNTFKLSTPDNIFPYTGRQFENVGNFILKGDTVVLNPGKAPRLPVVTVVEKELAGKDSIAVQIAFYKETYRNEQQVRTEVFPFEMLTLYFNKKKTYYNLRCNPITFKGCLFAPPVKQVHLLNADNQVNLPSHKVQKIGIFTYGFEKAVEVPILNPKANFFQITIVQPQDEEQMPRSKRVILKRGEAFYYEYQGKISTSPFLDNGLKKGK